MILLSDDAVTGQVKTLTGFSKTSLLQKLDELKDIRNILAHNRALTSTAKTIVSGVVVSLMQGVKYFKKQVLYVDFNPDISLSDEAISYFDSKMQGNDWGKFQGVATLSNDIYDVAGWPAEYHIKSCFPSASRLLEAYKHVLNHILAIAFNKMGLEFRILIPKKIDEMAIRQIINVFVETKDAWIGSEYEKQHPKYICNPKIWFYENQRTIDE